MQTPTSQTWATCSPMRSTPRNLPVGGGPAKGQEKQSLSTCPPQLPTLLTWFREAAELEPKTLTSSVPLPSYEIMQKCWKRSLRSGLLSPSWCCFSRGCWARGTKRYVEVAKWRVLVQKSDTGYKALCVVLVFEGPPCTFSGFSGFIFPAGTSKGWAGAVS